MHYNLNALTEKYLQELCVNIGPRVVGSDGNQKATFLLEEVFTSCNLELEKHHLSVIDWVSKEATLSIDEESFKVLASPYSLGCSIEAPLRIIQKIEELESENLNESIVLLCGDIAQEQIMPKNFLFYNPEEHQKIISLLESKNIKALITATGRNSALAGGMYPFPMFEDGDFNIPSVFTAEEEGERLRAHENKIVSFYSDAQRIAAESYNIIVKKEGSSNKKIVITAHIDTKQNTPGAIDNATGVVVLLLLAHLLKNYRGKYIIELVAFNGEDYYSVPGQMDYIQKQQDSFGDIVLNINIDGLGFKEGNSAISYYNIEKNFEKAIRKIMKNHEGIEESIQWPQGDHSIFIYFNRPAIAFTSHWFVKNMETQTITHTPKDSIDIVNVSKIEEVALVIFDILCGISK